MPDPRIGGLYVIIDPAHCRGRPPLDVARAAIAGGASVIQWRDKLRDKGPQAPDARALAGLCRERSVPFIVNDHADLALIVGADGVHLGQSDLPVEAVRTIAADRLMIGASTNNAAEAQHAVAHGADYVAVGAIFPTGTKAVTRPADTDRIAVVKAAVTVPVIAIGGINAENIASVAAAGADGAAVISAVCAAEDPEAAARELQSIFQRWRRGE